MIYYIASYNALALAAVNYRPIVNHTAACIRAQQIQHLLAAIIAIFCFIPLQPVHKLAWLDLLQLALLLLVCFLQLAQSLLVGYSPATCIFSPNSHIYDKFSIMNTSVHMHIYYSLLMVYLVPNIVILHNSQICCKN